MVPLNKRESSRKFREVSGIAVIYLSSRYFGELLARSSTLVDTIITPSYSPPLN